jgi:beta-galactosidase GanA
MREKNRAIVTKMCEEFKDKPGIIGWQIDNELFPYKDGCFCPLCRKKFISYIKEKYKTVENLNECWGLRRWSLDYISFDDILPPRHDTWNHPSLETEWLRLGSDNIVNFSNEQADILHRYFDVPIGTDMMPWLGLDHYKISEKLDVVQFNHYDAQGGLSKPSFWFDFLRPIKDRPFWNTETQTIWPGGVVALYGYQEKMHRQKGNCYINTWLPLAKGGEMNLYWLWRSHYAGHELHHGAVVTTTGRFYPMIDEIQKASSDFKKCADILNNTKIKSEIAITMSATSANNIRYAPMVAELDYQKVLIENYHAQLSNYNVDVIDTPHSLEGYKVLISPFLTTADENGFKERVLDWVKKGGRWLVGPMTDIYTDYAAKYRKKPYSFLEDVAGVKMKYQWPLNNAAFKAEWKDGAKLNISTYFEGYELCGAEGLASYTNDWLKGTYAITEAKYGKGSIVMIGTVINGDALKKLIGLEPIAVASNNIEIIKRIGEYEVIICLETENKEGEIVLDNEYTDHLTGAKHKGKIKIEPNQVLVLR